MKEKPKFAPFARAETLPEPWRSHFPKTGAEAQEWTPLRIRRALCARVLAVATTRIECAWCAYIDAVVGKDHEEEAPAVLASGCKMPETVALALFPEFEGVPYAR